MNIVHPCVAVIPCQHVALAANTERKAVFIIVLQIFRCYRTRSRNIRKLAVRKAVAADTCRDPAVYGHIQRFSFFVEVGKINESACYIVFIKDLFFFRIKGQHCLAVGSQYYVVLFCGVHGYNIVVFVNDYSAAVSAFLVNDRQIAVFSVLCILGEHRIIVGYGQIVKTRIFLIGLKRIASFFGAVNAEAHKHFAAAFVYPYFPIARSYEPTVGQTVEKHFFLVVFYIVGKNFICAGGIKNAVVNRRALRLGA